MSIADVSYPKLCGTLIAMHPWSLSAQNKLYRNNLARSSRVINIFNYLMQSSQIHSLLTCLPLALGFVPCQSVIKMENFTTFIRQRVLAKMTVSTKWLIAKFFLCISRDPTKSHSFSFICYVSSWLLNLTFIEAETSKDKKHECEMSQFSPTFF